MISIVIATHNHGAVLAETLDALIPAALNGLVRDVVIADGGSTDATSAIADGYGADVIAAGSDVASRINAAAAAAKCQWVLILPADVVLQPGFEKAVGAFIDSTARGGARLPVIEDGRLAQAADRLNRFLSPKISTERDCLLICRPTLERLGGFQAVAKPRGRAIFHLGGLDIVSFYGLARRVTVASLKGQGTQPWQSSWRRLVGKSATQSSAI